MATYKLARVQVLADDGHICIYARDLDHPEDEPQSFGSISSEEVDDLLAQAEKMTGAGPYKISVTQVLAGGYACVYAKDVNAKEDLSLPFGETSPEIVVNLIDASLIESEGLEAQVVRAVAADASLVDNAKQVVK